MLTIGPLGGLAGGEAAAGLAMCKGGPQGQTEPAKLAKGRADLRALKRSACRRQEAPKQQRAATTRTLVRLRRPKGVNAARRSRSDNKDFSLQFDD
ncbi:hypothetical protein SGRA_0339 [Saprospira grandis str. Lewin]|uniref:Uncharacterized protein n=1 Tax=Saprospira grandis (strain Lewin) TaxID=984262 RepID=H6L7P6_SAPGL|nr:hypothetical protein SGRA_0339 [Saprospira grandis str. Lewin]